MAIFGVVARGPYTVERARLGLDGFVTSEGMVETALVLLRYELAQAGIEPVTASRLWSYSGNCEGGLFVDRAVLTASCSEATEAVTLTVGVSSRALRIAFWAIILGSPVAGFALTPMVAPDARGRLIVVIVLSLSLVFMVPLALALKHFAGRAPVPEVVDRIDGVVRGWLAGEAVRVPAPRKKRKARAVATDVGSP